MYKFLLFSYFFPLLKFKYCENTIILLAAIKSESSESTITTLSNPIVAIVRFPPRKKRHKKKLLAPVLITHN